MRERMRVFRAGLIGRGRSVRGLSGHRERNLIERAFNRMKDYRRFAMRFDKLKVTFEATVCTNRDAHMVPMI